MSLNENNPLFVNHHCKNIYSLSENYCILKNKIFAGYILTEYFQNIFLQVCEILNIETLFFQDVINFVINKRYFSFITRPPPGNYIFRFNRCCEAFATDSFPEYYGNLFTPNYVYLQIETKSNLQPNDELTIQQIQELLKNFDDELTVEVCHL